MDRNGSPSRANTKRRAGEQYTPMRASFFTRFYRYMKKYWFLYMLVLPGLCFLLVFEYAPMYGITLAFKDYSPRLGVLGSPWVGLDHFKEMLADPNFIRAFKNTLIINVYNLVFGFTFSVFLSLMINEIRLKKVKSVDPEEFNFYVEAGVPEEKILERTQS